MRSSSGNGPAATVAMASWQHLRTACQLAFPFACAMPHAHVLLETCIAAPSKVCQRSEKERESSRQLGMGWIPDWAPGGSSRSGWSITSTPVCTTQP